MALAAIDSLTSEQIKAGRLSRQTVAALPRQYGVLNVLKPKPAWEMLKSAAAGIMAVIAGAIMLVGIVLAIAFAVLVGAFILVAGLIFAGITWAFGR